jgi:DNA-binding NtrC family response regulator
MERPPRGAIVKAEPVKSGDPREIILVIEDEDRVRAHNVEALRELGYTAIHASSGPEALATIDAGQDVSLLFTNIVLPDMTGRQLADEAAKRRPSFKVIFTTGYTRYPVVHNGVLDPDTNFLVKQHSIEQLARIVRRVLDS